MIVYTVPIEFKCKNIEYFDYNKKFVDNFFSVWYYICEIIHEPYYGFWHVEVTEIEVSIAKEGDICSVCCRYFFNY